MKSAVIKTGGKQYIVSEGTKLKVEKLTVGEKETITISEVLLTQDGDNVTVGMPFITSATVEANVLTQGKAAKVTGAHYKSKTRNKKMFGHRQPFTEIEITKITI
jgi:large subunit ribosomal protein L21